MTEVIVISDTGPLNYLILIDSIHVLPAIFGTVCAPPEVMAELKRSRRPELEPVRRWANSPPQWLTVQTPAIRTIREPPHGITVRWQEPFLHTLRSNVHDISSLWNRDSRTDVRMFAD